jgi:hypothetical protein
MPVATAAKWPKKLYGAANCVDVWPEKMLQALFHHKRFPVIIITFTKMV